MLSRNSRCNLMRRTLSLGGRRSSESSPRPHNTSPTALTAQLSQSGEESGGAEEGSAEEEEEEEKDSVDGEMGSVEDEGKEETSLDHSPTPLTLNATLTV